VNGTDAASKAGLQLEMLAKDLHGRGFTVQVMRESEYPCVSVVNAAVPQLSENVYAARGPDGPWWFWWSWADQIAPVSDVETAAFKIAYVLTPHANGARASWKG
jgi:hypothetical protein